MKTKARKLLMFINFMSIVLIAIVVMLLLGNKPIATAEEGNFDSAEQGKVNQTQLLAEEIITVRFIKNDFCIFSDEDGDEILTLFKGSHRKKSNYQRKVAIFNRTLYWIFYSMKPLNLL